MGKPTYDTTVARMAGNIAAGMITPATVMHMESEDYVKAVALRAVQLARAIVAETKRTAPAAEDLPKWPLTLPED